MSDRDDQILNHVGLYQLTLRRIIDEQFFDGKTSGNVIQRLVRDNQLQIRDGLPGRLSYYQLTRAEATRRGLPESRARALQNQALHTALAVLWFCTMSKSNRHRLEQSEVDRLFPESSPVAIHCVERNSDSHRLIRMKVIDPDSDDRTIVRSLRKAVFKTMALPGLRPWIESGRYCFSVLTETDSRIRRIEEIIKSDERLNDSATFIVEKTPGVRTLKQALHDQKEH